MDENKIKVITEYAFKKLMSVCQKVEFIFEKANTCVADDLSYSFNNMICVVIPKIEIIGDDLFDPRIKLHSDFTTYLDSMHYIEGSTSIAKKLVRKLTEEVYLTVHICDHDNFFWTKVKAFTPSTISQLMLKYLNKKGIIEIDGNLKKSKIGEYIKIESIEQIERLTGLEFPRLKHKFKESE